MRTDHHSWERHSPNGSGHGVDDIDERCGGPLAEQLDDDHGADEDTDEHDDHPCCFLLVAECRLEDIPRSEMYFCLEMMGYTV